MIETSRENAVSLFIATILFVAGIIHCRADTITWTNTAGGNWSDASSWFPNQVPASVDDVVITTGGSYVVTLDTAPTVNSLTLGGSSGHQTLTTGNNALTVNSASIVNTNGIFQLSGGTLTGSLTVYGQFNWTGGQIGPDSLGVGVTVATNALLVLAGVNGTDYSMGGSLINGGTVRLQSGNLQINYCGAAYGALNNLPGGLVDIQADDVSIDGSCGGPGFNNQGMVRKSGGTGKSSINALFNNTGTLDVQTGMVAVNGGGSGNGIFKPESGATLNFTATYEVDSSLVGPGTNLLSGGTFTLNGSMNGSNNVLGGATLSGIGTINGMLTWTSGQLGYASLSMSIATNGVLVLDGVNGTDYFLGQTLDNAGTIYLQSGNLDINWSTYWGNLVNQPGGLVNFQADVSIDAYGNAQGFVNEGTVSKSGGMGTSGINSIFSNSGTLDVQTGSISVTGGGSGNGVFKTEAGATLGFSSTSYEVDSALSGAGTNLLTAGTFTLNGSINTSNTVLAGATLTGNVAINGLFVWTSGVLGNANAGISVATNAVLVLEGVNGTDYIMGEYLTNAGTIYLQSGNMQINWYTYWGTLINLPGGLVNIAADVSIDAYGNNLGFINQGTLRKSGGTGTSGINPIFKNFGTVDVQTGTVSVNGGGNGNGVFNAEAGATLMFPASYEVDGSFTGAGTNLITGGTFTGNNVVMGTLTLSGDNSMEGVTTVASNGVVNIAGDTARFPSLVLTNYGTVNETNSSIYGGGGTQIYNYGLWNEQSDDNFYGEGYGSPATVFDNFGTFRKSSGANTTTLDANTVFNNNGTLDVQSGLISLANYNLTGGTVNFGINSRTNYGQIALSGNPATIDGTISANLNNGYVPIGGNSFTNLSYTSFAGLFTNAILPFADAWSTNYTSTAFILNVLNARPVFTALATNKFVVKELTALNVTNIADDADVPAQTLTYSLASSLNGMTVDPVTGIFTWTPQQTNSPATNIVSVAVIDDGTPSLSATNTYTVIVQEVNVAPTLPTVSTQIVNELTPLAVTNTATNFNIHSTITGYRLVSPLAGMTINSNGIITWTPSQLQSSATNTITTVVTNANPYDSINPSLTSTNSFTVIVKEVNVAPTLPTIAQQTVNELALLTVTNSATNFNIHSTITGYRLVSPPNGMSIGAGGIITWTPSQSQSPSTNTITTVVTNSNPYDAVNPNLTSTNNFTVIVNEVNVAPTLPVIAQTNVDELTLLTVVDTATNFNIHSTITGYRLVSPPNGMSINATGIITWTPAQTNSPSTNVITAVVTNSNPYDLVNPQLTATNSFTVVVKEVNVAPSLSVIPTQTINAQALLTVTNTAGESNIHAVLGYALLGAPIGVAINTNGIITWTPLRSQGPGTNTITTVVTNTDAFDTVNPHLSTTNSFTVIVYAPTLAPIGNYTVNAGQTVAFTNSATDNDSTRTLTFSLTGQPAGATVNSTNGVFNWRPTISQANTTNTIQVIVTDNSTPALTDNKSFTVVVNPLATSTLASVTFTNGHFTLQVNGTSGPDYIIEASTNMTQWVNIFTNPSATTPFQFMDTNANSFHNRFYRIQLSP